MVNFREITENLHKAVISFSENSDQDNTPIQKIIKDNVPLARATAISSRVNNLAKQTPFYEPLDLHKPTIDLDIPHYYGESTTPGHAHLILDVELSWEDYEELLALLARLKIIEQGYLNAARFRHESWMRVPWVKKQPAEKDSRFNPKTGWFETTIVQGDGSSL